MSVVVLGGGLVEVDPVAVRNVASVVEATAGELRRGYGSRSAGLAPVGRRGGGWLAADAVRSAVASWDALVRRLAGTAAFLGRDLLAGAADLAAADRQAAVVIATTAPGARVVDP